MNAMRREDTLISHACPKWLLNITVGRIPQIFEKGCPLISDARWIRLVALDAIMAIMHMPKIRHALRNKFSISEKLAEGAKIQILRARVPIRKLSEMSSIHSGMNWIIGLQP